jgi:hypothetical protein
MKNFRKNAPRIRSRNVLHFFNVPGTRKIREENLFFENARFWYKKVGCSLGGPIFMEVGSLLLDFSNESSTNHEDNGTFIDGESLCADDARRA